MKLSSLAIASIDSVLEGILGKTSPRVLDIKMRCESSPDEVAYVLFGTTDQGNDVSFPVDLPKDGLLRTDTVYGSRSILVEALEEALRGIEATGRLIDSVHPASKVDTYNSGYESVLRAHIDKEIAAQFASGLTLYDSFQKDAKINSSGYRIPFQGLREILDSEESYNAERKYWLNKLVREGF